MNSRAIGLIAIISVMGLISGCGRNGGPNPTDSAVIVGRIDTGIAGKLAVLAQLGCPDVVVTLNGSPATVVLEDDCSFVVSDVQPAEQYVVEVELVDLGVSGTVELNNVAEAEFIEILVQASDDSLTISVIRRATPDSTNDLPGLIDDNNVDIYLPAGTYDTDLTVDGNNFTLVGEAGDDCDDEGWTVLSGDVLILKNNATFRNIRFEGLVEVEGNNATFINVCFNGELIIFGNNTDIEDDGDDDDDDGDDDDDDDNANDNEDDDNGNDNDNDNSNGNLNDNSNTNDNSNVNGNDNSNSNDNND